ncbi:MAG: ABC transporter permease [Dehalococcoidia bacterium]|jgi:peptide/nickel transport system permease protein|nr:ABC transporter permease [Dehalococcoidia bacterium]PKB75473.1 MAG: ABC transporter permease [SAR202 cluster bacterium MP-SAtl-SRR3965592-G1]PKB82405.1 MAG: ABC transporter permease [SAR202 cluster bacterium MP-SInd-SRR3963457-G1]PKB84669.1 MAG: ABC transporter permease [SAR202 cluster bacterium MP-NPac-SRR3961935-G1]
MQRYIVRRVGEAVLALFALSIIIFLMVRLTGDPALLMLPPDAGADALEDIRHSMGLDKPLVAQYGLFIRDYATGSFGDSLRSKTPVSDLIKDRLPNSLKLVGAAAVIVLLISIPLGVLSAVYKGTWIDTLATGFAVLGQAIPVFWLGILMIQLFTVKLGWLPSSGMGGLDHYVMPAFALGFFTVAAIQRLLRSSMLEAMDSEYIKLARIKGLSEFRVVWKHALRNSLISVITLGGIYIAILITLGILVEVVFAWPGMGRLMFQGIVFRDFPVVQAVVLISAGIVIFSSLVVDIAYAYLDPRIRLQ